MDLMHSDNNLVIQSDTGEVKGSIKGYENIHEIIAILKNNGPDALTLNQIKVLMKVQHVPEPSVTFQNGFFMVGKNDFFKNVSYPTAGFIFKLSHSTNKDGVIYVSERKPAKTVADILKVVGCGKTFYSTTVKKEIANMEIFKKIKIEGEVRQVINPFVSASSREISSFQFIAFQDEMKQALHPLQYAYLDKLFNSAS